VAPKSKLLKALQDGRGAFTKKQPRFLSDISVYIGGFVVDLWIVFFSGLFVGWGLLLLMALISFLIFIKKESK
jgi:hypothetical protein